MIHSPFGRGERRLGDEDLAAVDQRAVIADADHAAPGARADQRAEAEPAEHAGKMSPSEPEPSLIRQAMGP